MKESSVASDKGVLIVGAGPTGLTLANDLARRGVPFQIIESSPGPGMDSKGLALNVSSQYGLRLLGIEGAIGVEGRPIRLLNINWNGKKYARVNFDYLDGDIKTLITQAQSKTEAELLAALRRVGHDVRWSHKLTGIEEYADHVAAMIETSDGNRALGQYQYVVGCDGKRSLVRDALGATFEGNDYPMYFALGDFRMVLQWSNEEVQYFIYEDGFFILVPIDVGVWRVVVKYDGAMPTEPLVPADITEVVNRYLRKEIAFGAPLWMSRAPFYNRVAGHLSSDRLFIAGDAAHLFSPIGGTGMNTGIQDALNLGWKLAFVHHGISGQAILRSYESERLPAIRDAAVNADLSTRLISGGDWQHPVIRGLAPAFKNRTIFRKMLPLTHSGMALKLPLQSASVGMGTLCPLYLHLDGLTKNRSAARNHVVCFVLLRGAQSHGCDPAEFDSLRQQLLAFRDLRILYIADHDSMDALLPALAANEELLRMTPERLARIAPDQAELSLVRPDGITIHASSFADSKEVGSMLSSHFYLNHKLDSHLIEAIFT